MDITQKDVGFVLDNIMHCQGDALIELVGKRYGKQSEEVLLGVMQFNGQLLEHIPNEHKSPQMCLEAVKQDSIALLLVPESLITEEMQLLRVQGLHPMQVKTFLNSLPEAERTKAICYAAMEKSPYALLGTPKQFKTEALYLIAAKTGKSALSLIPDAELTPVICELAVQLHIGALRLVPERLMTEDLCVTAIKTSLLEFGNVPEQYRFTDKFLSAYFSHDNGSIGGLRPEAISIVHEDPNPDFKRILRMLTHARLKRQSDATLTANLMAHLEFKESFDSQGLDLFEQILEQMERLEMAIDALKTEFVDVKAYALSELTSTKPSRHRRSYVDELTL